MSPVSRRGMIRGAGAALLAGAALGPFSRAGGSGEPSVRVKILGVAQDGGLPHLGCSRRCCVAARRDPKLRLRVACIGLIAEPAGGIFLIDATPDLESQIHDLRLASGLAGEPRRPVDGILLTHAHVGHYTGLIHLGKEAMAAREVPVHASPRMCAFIGANKPWSRLVDWGHVALNPLKPGEERQLAPGLSVGAIPVPHRDEDSDTLGFIVKGPSRTLLYVPDTDQWSRWPRPLAEILSGVDHALLDGSFFDASEVTWRDPSEIPHPTIRQTMSLLDPVPPDRRGQVAFIHLNHSNPALVPSGSEAAEIRRRGYAVARRGEEILL